MKIKKHIKKILAIGTMAVFLGAALGGCAQAPTGFTQEELDTAKDKAYMEGEGSVDITSDNAAVWDAGVEAGKDSVVIPEPETRTITIAGETKDVDLTDAMKVIDQLRREKEELQKIASEAQTAVDAEDANGYNFDKLIIGAEYNFTVSDREIDLFDGEVEFDSEEYDAEEVVDLINFIVANNHEDEYKAEAYLQIPKDGVKYIMSFDEELVTSTINIPETTTEDYWETLTFNFLGEEVEISKWVNNDTVTFTKGTEMTARENEVITYENKDITIRAIGNEFVLVDVNGISKKIKEDDTQKVNGIEIRVTDVVETTSWREGIATLEIGDDVFFKVEDGDEYDDKDLWKWVIDSNSIGIKLNEDFTDVEEDEIFKAIAEGDQFCLPNDYVCVEYDGLVDEDTEEYNFELDDGFVEVDGNFVDGIESYNKIYINVTDGKIYDNDNGGKELMGENSIELGDTKLDLTTDITDATYMYINNIYDIRGNIKLALNLSELNVDGEDEPICSGKDGEEEDYLTTYGIVIKNPEEACEDHKFEIVIPKEELTASITIRTK